MTKENKNEFGEEFLYHTGNKLDDLSEKDRDKMEKFCEDYKIFLTKAKTEREVCDFVLHMLEEAGFAALDTKQTLRPGDRVYTVNRGKGIVAAVIGQEPLRAGVNLVGAHIDAPRLDLKPNPLYEEDGIAYFKTHYYGGIKKYQWTAIPLSIHGMIVKEDGTQIQIRVGEEADDPIFCITDLLPHLAQEQMQKKMADAVPGESLNVLIGNTPCENKEVQERVKRNILHLLNEKYDITEEDFLSSEIEIVPAFPAKDMGFDRSMIAGYGQDDRVCAYTALRAVLGLKEPRRTGICLLVDKEEVGSMGNTGMQSRYFENVLAKMCMLEDAAANSLTVREALSNSVCLSADVGVVYDPNYASVCDKHNTAQLNGGLMLTKYTGSRGKGGSSDASAELVAKIRGIFRDGGVLWQMGELGKVDCGGGGTIAQYVANLDMEVVDCGVALMSMHSPYEVAGKLDIYMAYKGYRTFMQQA